MSASATFRVKKHNKSIEMSYTNHRPSLKYYVCHLIECCDVLEVSLGRVCVHKSFDRDVI